MTTHIVTLGGGGFSMSPNATVTQLDRYLVGLATRPNPLVCFVPTGSADDPRYINRFLTAFGPMGLRTTVLTLWEGARASVRQAREADVFVIGGGSTVNLDALLRAHRVDTMFAEIAAERDVVFGGIAAGASVFFEACTTDSFGAEIEPWRGGLGMLTGSFCPHYDGEEDRAPFYTNAVGAGLLPDGYGVDDGAALHFVDGKLTRALAERRGAGAWRVSANFSPVTSGVVAEPLKMRAL